MLKQDEERKELKIQILRRHFSLWYVTQTFWDVSWRKRLPIWASYLKGCLIPSHLPRPVAISNYRARRKHHECGETRAPMVPNSWQTALVRDCRQLLLNFQSLPTRHCLNLLLIHTFEGLIFVKFPSRNLRVSKRKSRGNMWNWPNPDSSHQSGVFHSV